MLIGYDFFNGQCFDSIVGNNNYHYMEIKNAKFDEIKIDNGYEINYNTEKQEWDYNTLFLAKFQNNLEAGNISLENGKNIEFIRIKKRRKDDMKWEYVKDIPFNMDKKEYNYNDYFVESLTDYEYAVLPTDGQKIEGKYNIKEVECFYDDIFILGKNEQYRLVYDIGFGDIITVSPSSIIETLGNKYPFEVSNGDICYRRGNVKATLLTDDSVEGYEFNRKKEKEYRNKIYCFLIDKKPKVFKESEGNYMLISIKTDSVKLTPINELGRRLYHINFEFTEIDDVNNINVLKECGLLI